MANKISIIIPIYNVEKYLNDCLDSVFRQSYQDFEVIAINDGSTDNSLKIIESYKEEHSERLTIIDQENKGISASRNAGINASKGEFIYFLDSDDFIPPNMLEKCIQYFSNHDVDSIFFNAIAFTDGINQEYAKNFDYTRKVPERVYENLELFSLFMRGKYIVHPCCFMLKKEKFKELRFPDGVIHEDNYYTTKILMSESTTSYVTQDVLYHRRVRPNSIVTQAKTRSHYEGYYTVEKMLLLEHGKSKLVHDFCRRLFYTGTDVEIGKSDSLKLSRRITLVYESFRYGLNYKFCMRLLFPRCYSFIKSTALQVRSSH